MRAVACAAAAALVTVGLAACGSGGNSGSAASASAKGPYVIADMTPLSGPSYLPGELDPIDLAATEINAKGGILGRKVVIKPYDSGITATTALTATRLALSQGVDAIIGYSVDAGLTASISLIKQANIPLIDLAEGPTTSQGALGTDLAFSVAVQTDEESLLIAQYFGQTLHATSIGLTNSEDTNPVEMANYVQQYAQQYGISHFVREQFPETITDLTAQVLDLKSVSADAELAYPNDDALLIRQMYQNGEGNIPVMLSTGGAFEWQTHAIPADETAHVTYVSSCGTLYSGDPVATAFTKNLEAAYPSITAPESFQPDTYDAVFILKAAIEGAKSFDTSAVVAQLKTLTYNGVCGTYHANASGAMLNQLEVISLANYQPKVLKSYSNLQSDYSAYK